MKRKAETELNRHEIENGNIDTAYSSNKEQTKPENPAPVDLSQRRIVKLLVPSQFMNANANGNNQTKGSFHLAGALSTNTATENKENKENANSVTPSFLNRNSNKEVKQEDDQKAPEKPASSEEKNTATSSTQNNTEEKKQENNNDQTNTEKKPSKSKSTGGVPSLFASIPKLTTETPKVDDKTKPSLLGDRAVQSENKNPSLFSKNISPGLFGQTPDVKSTKPMSLFSNPSTPGPFSAKKENPITEEQPKPEAQSSTAQQDQNKDTEKKPSLFASIPTLNLFQPTTNKFANLFSGPPKAQPNINLPTKQTSLFGKKDDDEVSDEGDNQEGDDEPQRSNSPEREEQSFNDPNYTRIAVVENKRIAKFKAGDNPRLQLDGEISILKAKTEDSYFIVYRSKTKIIYYQGQLLKKLSTIAYINPRQESLSVVAFTKKNPDDKKEITDEKNEGKPKIVAEKLKIMFHTSDDCNSFKQELEKIVN